MEQEQKPEHQKTEADTDESSNLITIDQFALVELKVGQILHAEKIEKSKKLMRLSVSLGEPKGARQIVAGIAEHFDAESLVGRKVCVVANLAPARLMGTESQGMLLAARTADGALSLIDPGADVPVGTAIG